MQVCCVIKDNLLVFVILAEHDAHASAVQTNSTGYDEVEGPSKDAEKLTAEVNRLTSINSEYNTRIDELQEQKKQLEAKLGKQTSVSVLGEQIGELTKKHQHEEAELKRQNDELKAVIKTKEDEIARLNEQLSRTKIVVEEISEQLRSKDYELANEKLQKEECERKLQEATAADTETEKVERKVSLSDADSREYSPSTSLEAASDEVAEVRCQLRTSQQLCDELRRKLRYATAQHGILMWLCEPMFFNSIIKVSELF